MRSANSIIKEYLGAGRSIKQIRILFRYFKNNSVSLSKQKLSRTILRKTKNESTSTFRI